MKWLCSFGIASLKRCIIGNKNLMPIVWQIRIYDYLRSNILMLRLICDQWVMMLDKWFVDVKVSEEVSIPAGITRRARAIINKVLLVESKNERDDFKFIWKSSLFVFAVCVAQSPCFVIAEPTQWKTSVAKSITFQAMLALSMPRTTRERR